jgi:hypothetical protein
MIGTNHIMLRIKAIMPSRNHILVGTKSNRQGTTPIIVGTNHNTLGTNATMVEHMRGIHLNMVDTILLMSGTNPITVSIYIIIVGTTHSMLGTNPTMVATSHITCMLCKCEHARDMRTVKNIDKLLTWLCASLIILV